MPKGFRSKMKKSFLIHLGTTRNCQYKTVNLSEKELKKMGNIEWNIGRKSRWASSNIIPK